VAGVCPGEAAGALDCGVEVEAGVCADRELTGASAPNAIAAATVRTWARKVMQTLLQKRTLITTKGPSVFWKAAGRVAG
jgi:hypothetical protein